MHCSQACLTWLFSFMLAGCLCWQVENWSEGNQMSWTTYKLFPFLRGQQRIVNPRCLQRGQPHTSSVSHPDADKRSSWSPGRPSPKTSNQTPLSGVPAVPIVQSVEPQTDFGWHRPCCCELLIGSWCAISPVTALHAPKMGVLRGSALG